MKTMILLFALAILTACGDGTTYNSAATTNNASTSTNTTTTTTTTTINGSYNNYSSH